MKLDNFYIAIAGNIGSGKTTLSELLGKELGMRVYEEPVRDNPFLKPYYEAMNELAQNPTKHTKKEAQKWGYALQEFFLLNRVLDHKKIMMIPEPVIQDRSIYEDKLFAEHAYKSDFMSKEHLKKYYTLYKMLTTSLKAPDVLVYLQASEQTLKKRVQKRIDEDPTRITEKELAKEENNYLLKLNEQYTGWFEEYKGPKLLINTDEKNFEKNKNDLEYVVWEMKKIERNLR